MRGRTSLGAICGAALLFAACDGGGGGAVDAATVSQDAAQPADGSVGDAGPSGSDGAADADALVGPVEGEPCEGMGSRICTLDGEVLQCRQEGGDRLWAPFEPQ